MRRILLLALALGLGVGLPAARAVVESDQARLADGLYARGLYELAAAEYRALDQQAVLTNREVVVYRLAECLRNLGRAGEAAAAYDRVITGFPATVYALRSALRRAKDDLQAGRFDEVADRLASPKDSTVDPDLRPAWRYFLAHAERRRGRAKAAEPVYRRLLKEDGETPYTVFARLELAELIQAHDPASAEAPELLEAVRASGPASPAGRQAALRLAATRFTRGEYAESADAYAALVKEDPGLAATVRVASAWAHFKAGRWPATLELTVTAPDADSLYLQANSLRLLQREEEADRVYRRLFQQHPDHPLAETGRYEAAVLALARQAYAEARRWAAEVKPTPALAEDLLWIQAEAARGSGAREEAIALYDRLAQEHRGSDRAAAARYQAARLVQEAGRWEEASERFRAVAEDDRGRAWAADAWYASAYARQQLGQAGESIRDWARLLEQAPDYPKLDDVLYAWAQAEREAGRAAEARRRLEQLLERFPRSARQAEAHYLLGTLLENDEKWEAAEYHYRLAARAQPESALAQRIEFRRVAVLQRQGRHDEAARALNDLLARPDGARAVPAPLLDWLARWNAQQADWPGMERAAVALAGQGGPWQTLGWYQAGRAREELGRNTEAMAAYRQAGSEQVTRESVEASFRLGRLAALAGDAAEAHRALTQAAEQAGDESLADIRARSYLALAGVAEQEGKPEDALRLLLGVALLYDDPEVTPEALYRAADNLRRQGRTAEGAQTLQELKQRYPDSPWAAKDDIAPR